MREFIVSPDLHKILVESLPEIPDARGQRLENHSRSFLKIPVRKIRVLDLYYLMLRLNNQELESISNLLGDSVCTRSHVNAELPEGDWDYRVVVRYKAGVTDNVGSTARDIIQEVLKRNFSETETVVFGRQFLLSGVNEAQASRISTELLHNELVEDAFVLSGTESEPDPTLLGRQIQDFKAVVESVSLPSSDADLIHLSDQKLLALNVDELHAIQEYFADSKTRSYRRSIGLSDEPTDVELECLAQTWSEHCFHKIFRANIDYTDPMGQKIQIDSLYATYIKETTRLINSDFVVSAFHDNAGIVRFHQEYDLAYKIETHNSPSALDPYGGAMTGIVGVDRDILGAGLGCEPLAHVKGFCLGNPADESSPARGLLHPQRIRDGVHLGVQEGGNQSGIPLMRGFEIFDSRYGGKPLVFCGTLGKIPHQINSRDSFEKKILPGDYIVMIGGRVGKDGIHGATFSSLALTQNSPVQAVQIGDPITQKRVMDMLMEARNLGLYRCITDNGAGGLSSSVGEMARITGGASLDLSRVPLKYPGLNPWEIFVSESQERMTLAVQPENLEPILKLCYRRGVEASCIGNFNKSGKLEVSHGDQMVASLDMEFLHGGNPVMELKAHFDFRQYPEPDLSEISPSSALLGIVSGLNLVSKEEKLRQYDWEVKGLSAVKLLIGVDQDIIPDASVIQVSHSSKSGAALSESLHPWLSDLDPYRMSCLIVDEAVRKVLATGAKLGEIVGVDNFCWPSVVNTKLPDLSYKLGQLVRACQGLQDACLELGVPLVSGKDSMSNDCTLVDPPISIPPTLLFSVLARIEDVSACVTLDWKLSSDLVFLIGETRDELGASELYRSLNQEHDGRPALGSKVPTVNFKASMATYEALQRAHSADILHSCHALGRGGLATGLAMCSMAGGLGVELNLTEIHENGPCDNPWSILFSESGGRFLVSIPASKEFQFRDIFSQSKIARIGQVSSSREILATCKGESILNIDLEDLKEAFHKAPEEKR